MGDAQDGVNVGAMSASKPWIWIPAVLVAASALWWFTGQGSSSNSQSSGTAESSSQEPLQCRFQVGDRLAFRWTLNLEFRADAGSARGMRRFLELGVSGAMDWRVLSGPEASDGAWIVAARLHDLTGSEEGRSALWTPAMDAPFLLRIRPDCGFQRFGFPKALPSHDGNTVVGLLQSMEVVLDRDGVERSWTRTRFDARGTSLWSYELTDAPGPTHTLTRRRLSYSRLWAEDPSTRITVSRSEGSAVLSEDGDWLVTAEIAEHLRTSDSGGPGSTEKIALSLHREQRETSPLDNWTADLTAYTWREGSDPPAEAPAVKGNRQLPPLLANATVDLLMSEILPLLASDQSSVRKEGMRLLESWLRERPEGAAALIQWMREGHIPVEGQAPLWLALERAGTPEAVAALKAAMEDRSLGSVSQVRAIAAYIDGAPPDPQTVQSMVEASRRWEGLTGSEELSVAGSATMALGTMESRFDQGHPQLAEALHAEVEARLGSATNPHEVRALLEAVGNSGDESYLEQLTQKLADDDRLTRRVAARALRRMEPEQIQALVSQGLQTEPDAKVKVSLTKSYLQSLEESGGKVDPAVITAAMAQLTAEQTPKLRAQLIRLLGAAVSVSPAAKQALIAHFSVETEPGLLKLIGQFVSATDL